MIHSRRYEDLDLIVHVGTGDVALSEVREAVNASHQGRLMPLEIWDLSRAKPDGIAIEDLGELLSGLFSMDNSEKEEKTAFIVPGADTRELTLLFQRLAEFQEYPVEFRSFPDLPSAVHWLFRSDWEEPMKILQRDMPGPSADPE